MSLTIQKNSRAFTLVEMIVSLAVFSMVAVVALGALTKIVSANRKAQTLQTSITNLNFALDSMSRELRVSPNYHCGVGDRSAFTQSSLSVSNGCSGISNQNAFIVFNSTKVLAAGGPCNPMYAYRFYDPENDGTFDLQKAQQQNCGSGLGSFSSIID